MLAVGDTGLETCRQPSSSLLPHPATMLPRSLLPFSHPWDGKKKSLFSFTMTFMHFYTPHSFLSSGAFRKCLGKESGCGGLGQ